MKTIFKCWLKNIEVLIIHYDNRIVGGKMKNILSNKLSVEEARSKLFSSITSHTGWKFLKSQNCLKRVVGDLVFQIDFFSSKWNQSYERVEIECECQLWCKKFDRTLNVNSQVGYYKFEPSQSEWWDISDEEKLYFTIEQLCKQMDETILPLCKDFEDDFLKAAVKLTEETLFNTYHIKLQFLDFYAGRENIIPLVQAYINTLSDVMKQDVESYKQGDRSKSWMINPSNLKYIIDNNLI